MSALERPPDHPLIELVHDLRAGLVRIASDEARASTSTVHGHERLRWVPRSVRRFADAFDLFLDELEVRSFGNPGVQSKGNGEREDDFQTIMITDS